MNAKNLIAVLQLMDPEDEVCFGIGDANDYDYREACAKAELLDGECLSYLKVKDANVSFDTSDGEQLLVYLHLEQFNLPHLYEDAKKFDTKYKLIKED